MNRLIRLLGASLVVFLALESFSYAGITVDEKNTPKIGSTINLADQKIVWHQDSNYVIEVSGKDYLVMKDQDDHAIVVKRIHNLASFIADPQPTLESGVRVGLSAGWGPFWGYDPIIYPFAGFYSPVVIRPAFHHPVYRTHVIGIRR
jgi:hypothetical protein